MRGLGAGGVATESIGNSNFPPLDCCIIMIFFFYEENCSGTETGFPRLILFKVILSFVFEKIRTACQIYMLRAK